MKRITKSWLHKTSLFPFNGFTFFKTSQFPFDVFAFGRAIALLEMTKKVVFKTSDFPFKIEH